jgi:hypothetical protein
MWNGMKSHRLHPQSHDPNSERNSDCFSRDLNRRWWDGLYRNGVSVSWQWVCDARAGNCKRADFTGGAVQMVNQVRLAEW